MSITEIKREPRNQEAIAMAQHILKLVEDNDEATEIFAMVKINGVYHRLSTGIKDLMQTVAVLEVAKYDCINRMGE